jgi:hypothetical protein
MDLSSDSAVVIVTFMLSIVYIWRSYLPTINMYNMVDMQLQAVVNKSIIG